MTIGYVRQLLTLQEGDRVLTAYGTGTVQRVQRVPLPPPPTKAIQEEEEADVQQQQQEEEVSGAVAAAAAAAATEAVAPASTRAASVTAKAIATARTEASRRTPSIIPDLAAIAGDGEEAEVEEDVKKSTQSNSAAAAGDGCVNSTHLLSDKGMTRKEGNIIEGEEEEGGMVLEEKKDSSDTVAAAVAPMTTPSSDMTKPTVATATKPNRVRKSAATSESSLSRSSVVEVVIRLDGWNATLYAVDDGMTSSTATSRKHRDRNANPTTNGPGGAAVVHKMLSLEQFTKAMEKLEEYRVMQLEILSQERQQHQLEIHQQQQQQQQLLRQQRKTPSNKKSPSSATVLPYDSKCCVGCWFDRPDHTGGAKHAPRAFGKKPPKRKAAPCDVCGNPTCPYHRQQSTASSPSSSSDSNTFTMCLDCSRDLDHEMTSLLKVGRNSHLYDYQMDQLYDTVIRLLNIYDRMMICLSFCIPLIGDLTCKLTTLSQRNSKFQIGTSSLSFVGGALGIAGTATLLTPVGLPLLIAAIATSGSAATMQGSYQLAVSSTTKENNTLANRIVGWYGLCVQILKQLETLRKELVVQVVEQVEQEQREQQQQRQQQQGKDIDGAMMKPGTSKVTVNNRYADSASRASSVGLRVTSAVGAAGAGASNLTPILQTSLQMTPIVGAVLSVSIMAVDGHNITQTLRKLKQPHIMTSTLLSIKQNFCIIVPSSIENTALILLQATREIQAKRNKIYEDAILGRRSTTTTPQKPSSSSSQHTVRSDEGATRTTTTTTSSSDTEEDGDTTDDMIQEQFRSSSSTGQRQHQQRRQLSLEELRQQSELKKLAYERFPFLDTSLTSEHNGEDNDNDDTGGAVLVGKHGQSKSNKSSEPCRQS